MLIDEMVLFSFDNDFKYFELNDIVNIGFP